uniref:Alcohol dehydrogenase-like N-terminal domain-containing protein n=1 Tax=Zea mays TaxID=4577 RepID=B6T0I9_MAIZE|nr:hypothetical protein [Zea mays]
MENQGPKPIRCKAAVCRAAGEPLAIEEVVVDTPKAHEVRIRIICTSLCHSDVTFWRMKDLPDNIPRIFGHEAFGYQSSPRFDSMSSKDVLDDLPTSRCTRIFP